MGIRVIRPEEHADVLALVDAELRPAAATTSARDDFPLALHAGNRNGLYVCEQDGRLVGCLTSIVWSVRTSLGQLSVGAVGSVVTDPGFRGRGISGRLQKAALQNLRNRGVQLVVLWSDRPEVYAGRGFRPAGVEYHVDLRSWRPGIMERAGGTVLDYQAADLPQVEALYRRHRYGVVREPGQSELLYAMPGTRGLVWRDTQGCLSAYAFCGKGADFRNYVAEWGGERHGLTGLLDRIRRERLARYVLAPQGAEALVRKFLDQGAAAWAQPSGLWAILNSDSLRAATGNIPMSEARIDRISTLDPGIWLGSVLPDGSTQEGICRLAIWGLDSI